jgi:hypothetical protein
MYKYLNFSDADTNPDQIYFLYAAKNTYKGNLFINLLFLFILKFLYITFLNLWKICNKN